MIIVREGIKLFLMLNVLKEGFKFFLEVYLVFINVVVS